MRRSRQSQLIPTFELGSSRSQTQTPSGHYVKRNTDNGRFMDVKSDTKPFKGVRKEK